MAAHTSAGKWEPNPDKLDDLREILSEIPGKATALVVLNRVLAYIICSLLDVENSEQISAFTAITDWKCTAEHRFTPLKGGDGFFCALLTR